MLMFLPSSLLEKVYVKGSLKNIEGGFEFKLKNIVDSGTLGGVVSLTIDGETIPVTNIRLTAGTRQFQAQEITFRAPAPFPYGTQATIQATTEQPLSAGVHAIVLTVNVIEAGKLQIKVSDEIVA
jgi:hypothetical protein